MPKLVRLGYVGLMVANTVVLDSVFSFKSSNTAITNSGFEFDSRQRHLIFKFLQLPLSWIAAFEFFIFVPVFFLPILLLKLLIPIVAVMDSDIWQFNNSNCRCHAYYFGH